ncbi:endonuclease NucS [Pseudoalteromonas piscicida]|uniref:endonuclease NucS domain-containing protein n=1 Tax=Pseudoalteromonas piscicida TaxID=43662 RepID=UPI001EFDAAA4|nr:endonuclease NucS [Pseudoalteromonas piscicida]
MKESTIRDKLALNLEILENGLQLLHKEYFIENKLGASGYIDILAKDEFDNLVVIELKKSDQSARAGIHELFKYLALLVEQQGIDPSKLRVILVSTTWHELLIPFSEFRKSVPYHTQGINLKVDSSGAPVQAEVVTVAQSNQAVCFSRIQHIYFYREATARDQAIKGVVNALRTVGIKDFFLLKCDYNGSSTKVIYPHAIYIVFSSPFHSLSKEEISDFKIRISWDDELDFEDENFICALPNVGIYQDSTEIGNPEKLGFMMEEWIIEVIFRSGRVEKNKSIVSDNQLIEMALFTEGGSSYYLAKVTSPKFADSWASIQENGRAVCLGNSFWEEAFPLICEYIGNNQPEAKVSFQLYNAADTIITLFAIAKKSIQAVPNLQIVSQEKEGNRYIFSLFEWKGKVLSFSAESFVNSLYESIDEWMCFQHYGVTFQKEDLAMMLAGIHYPLIEVWNPIHGQPTVSRIEVFSGSLEFKPCEYIPQDNVGDFFRYNQSFLKQMEKMMYSVGIDGL